MLSENFYIHIDSEDYITSLYDFIKINIVDDDCGHIDIEDIAAIIALQHGESVSFVWVMGDETKVTRVDALAYRNHPETKTLAEHLALINDSAILTSKLLTNINDEVFGELNNLASKHDLFIDDDYIALGSTEWYAYPDFETLKKFYSDLSLLANNTKTIA